MLTLELNQKFNVEFPGLTSEQAYGVQSHMLNKTTSETDVLELAPGKFSFYIKLCLENATPLVNEVKDYLGIPLFS